MKYIVYKTTNLVNGKFYIGVHKVDENRIEDGYLGSGATLYGTGKIDRCTTVFHFAIRKHGGNNFKRETLFEYDSYEEALLKEAEIVTEEFVKRKDNYNCCVGGGMPPQWNKMKCYQYNLNGEFVCEYESQKDAERSLRTENNTLSCASIGHVIKTKRPYNNFYFTNEKFEKLNLEDFNRVYNGPERKIYLYDSELQFIKEYYCITDFLKENDGITDNAIRNRAKKSTAYKNFYVSYDNPENFKPNYKATKLICQYNLKGEYIMTYVSVSEACRINRYIPTNLKERKYKGYYWSYNKYENYLTKKN